MDKRALEITRTEKNVPIIETPAEIRMLFKEFIVVLDKLDGKWSIINKRYLA